MASSTVVSRLSSRLQPFALILNKRSLSSLQDPFLAFPVELSRLESMLPLHSAIASARLRSSLTSDSHC